MPVGCPLPLDRETVMDAIRSGRTRAELANELGVTVRQVAKWCAKHHCPLPPLHRSTCTALALRLPDPPLVSPEVAKRRARQLHARLVGPDPWGRDRLVVRGAR